MGITRLVPRGTVEVGVQRRCFTCMSGDRRVGWRNGRVVHRLMWPPQDATHWHDLPSESDLYAPCADYDAEGRHIAETLGFYTFAWWPVRCRNGKRRWLTSIERHADGSVTAGNRAF